MRNTQRSGQRLFDERYLRVAAVVGRISGWGISQRERIASCAHGTQRKAYENAFAFCVPPTQRVGDAAILPRKKVDDETAGEVMQRLSRIGWWMMKEFARQWSPAGRRTAPGESGAAGLNCAKKAWQQVIRSAVSQVDEEEGACELPASGMRLSDSTSKPSHRCELFTAQGFSYDVSRQVTNRLWQKVGAHMDRWGRTGIARYTIDKRKGIAMQGQGMLIGSWLHWSPWVFGIIGFLKVTDQA